MVALRRKQAITRDYRSSSVERICYGCISRKCGENGSESITWRNGSKQRNAYASEGEEGALWQWQ